MKQLISVGEILKKGWHATIHNYSELIKPILVLAAVIIVTMVLDTLVTVPTIIGLILAAITAVLGLWLDIVLIKMVQKALSGKKINAAEEFSAATPLIFSYFWVSILVVVAVIAGLILFIIPGLILAIYLAFATYIFVLENKRGIEALKSSYDLVNGRWWATLWRVVAPNIIAYVLVGLFAIGIYSISQLGNVSITEIAGSDPNIIRDAIVSVVFTFATPLFVSFMILIYKSLKETR